MTRSILLGALLALVAAARPDAGRGQESESASGGAAAAFSGLETRLMDARTVRLGFDITSEGAFESDLRGTLAITGDDRVELVASGTFGGQAVDLKASSDGRGFTYGNGDGLRTGAIPPRLKEALLIGLTRMGLLHNLAVLTANSPPDRAEGGVREWVRVHDFGWSADVPPAARFSIEVAGTPVGSASLGLDPDGNPVIRRQTVQFPQGEMRVVERYSGVEIEP